MHPLTHLPRAATGICLFYCQNIKANSQRGSSTASRVACHQGAAYFDRFQLSVGVATLLLCYTTAGVTWRLSTDYVVLKYIPYVHTYRHMNVRVGVCASWQPLSFGLCRQTYLHMLAAYFNKSCWISCRTDSRYTHTHTERYSLTLTRRWVACLFDNS